MTTRQIEDCFNSENLESTYTKITYWIVDPHLLSKDAINDLMNMRPGKIIKLRNSTRGVMVCHMMQQLN